MIHLDYDFMAMHFLAAALAMVLGAAIGIISAVRSDRKQRILSTTGVSK